MNYDFLSTNKIIPVVVLKHIEDTIPKLSALSKGGIKVAEITFRTDCAEDVIKLASAKLSDMLIGAGTVINAEQCRKAIKAGAKFIVSPGLSADVFCVCQQADVPYIPGIVTPTEIMAAKALGMNVLKFFPASAYGGVKTLKALSAAFPDVKFVPTGGVGIENMQEFLSQKFVVAIGGSWMMKGDDTEIENLSAEAVAIAKEIVK